MAICDVCNREGPNVVVPCAAFRRAVLVDGFDPIRRGLVPGRSPEHAGLDLEVWYRLVRENDTDWGLCADCHAAYRQAVAPPSGPPVPGHGLPDSLAALRDLQPLPAPPSVPAPDKVGFLGRLFGSAKPWGGVDDALALVRHGRIADARELLRRLVAHGDDAGARLLLCLESKRPPADASLQPSRIVPRLSANEKHAFDMLVAFGKGDYDWLGQALLGALGTRPDSALGAFLMLAGFVGASDLWLQTQLLHPRRRELESIIVGKPFKALALLLERRHDEAWQAFWQGAADPASIVTSYGNSLQLEPSPEEQQTLAIAARDYCEIGLGLVLFDLGYEAARRTHFARLEPRLSANLAEACRLLA